VTILSTELAELLQKPHRDILAACRKILPEKARKIIPTPYRYELKKSDAFILATHYGRQALKILTYRFNPNPVIFDDGLFSLNAAAKKLGMNPRALIQRLVESGVLERRSGHLYPTEQNTSIFVQLGEYGKIYVTDEGLKYLQEIYPSIPVIFDGSYSWAEVAEKLGMRPRVLIRRLVESGILERRSGRLYPVERDTGRFVRLGQYGNLRVTEAGLRYLQEIHPIDSLAVKFGLSHQEFSQRLIAEGVFTKDKQGHKILNPKYAEYFIKLGRYQWDPTEQGVELIKELYYGF
jgi:phage antirepressor YoqD-like protein